MSNADDFAEQIAEWAKVSGKRLDKVDRAFKIQLSTMVIEQTPVGNKEYWSEKARKYAPAGYVGGRARNNWFPSIGAPSNKTTKRTGAKGQAAKRRAVKIAGQSVGQVYYLTNNLPYIRRLEYEGHSQQAPSGMLRRSVKEARQALKRAIIEAKRIK
tara:strand:- start:293 stop:763 length:471 start_codon:yes stop_codon:yes gene_type:complete